MLALLFVLTFLESVAGTLLQRGIYFYTHEIRAFSETANLCLAFGFGTFYVAGALKSHAIAARLGEKRLLVLALVALAALHALLASVGSVVVLCGGFFATGFVQGAKWPVVESYVSAGRPPKQLLPLLSRYNVTW